MKTLSLLFALAFLGCTPKATTQAISNNLDACLAALASYPTTSRCSCVSDAKQRCNLGGFVERCYVTPGQDTWNVEQCERILGEPWNQP